MSDEPHGEKRDRVPPVVFKIATWFLLGALLCPAIIVLIVMACASTGNLRLTKPKPVGTPPIQRTSELSIDN